MVGKKLIGKGSLLYGASQMCVCSVGQSCPTLWDPRVAWQPPVMGFSRQDYWCGLPFASPGDLPDPGIQPYLLHWQADSLPPFESGGN